MAMARNRQAQVNVRSDALKRRVDDVVARTGMSATRFLEEAASRFEPELESFYLIEMQVRYIGNSFNHYIGRSTTLEQTSEQILGGMDLAQT